jgi:response regulator RpfG family c-di-GMP phosphodiesterase
MGVFLIGALSRTGEPMSQPNVLIVEDSRTVRKLLVKQLEDVEATVTEAVDGEEGLELARAREFDLVISDIDMPRLNGFDLCKKLKSDPATRTTPVIILSTNDREAQVEKGFRVGASAYVTKAKASEELIPRIKEVLARSAFFRDRLVLVVDDSRLVRESVREGLSQAGFKVLCAENGQRAMQLLEDHIPDIILSDINMPVMDGVGFCRAVRARADLQQVPFMVMSTESDRRVMREMLSHGATAFMVKPFHIEQLIITTEKLLSDQFQLLLKERQRLDTERNMLLATISSLIQALEARDHYTRGHSEEVARIACGMGRVMRFSGPDLERLETAARLHDVGKIGIRDEILLKPGRLTEEEYRIIQGHPVHGADILRPIPSLAPIIPAVLHHHERMDGKGYPHGLKGSNIHLWARMIAVGDVYHALTSERPYRAPMPMEKVFDIIESDKGTHLCPDCVAAFFTFMQQEEDSPPTNPGKDQAQDPRENHEIPASFPEPQPRESGHDRQDA